MWYITITSTTWPHYDAKPKSGSLINFATLINQQNTGSLDANPSVKQSRSLPHQWCASLEANFTV